MGGTIREIARRASVSIGTVSRVMNGAQNVGPAIRARVERLIRETNYRPNARARGLARRESHSIGVLLANRPVVKPFNAWLLNGIMQACEKSNYTVTVARFDYRAAADLSVSELPLMLRSVGMTDCLIAAGTNYPNLFRCLEEFRVPFVYAGNSYVSDSPPKPVDRVLFDQVRSGRQPTQYLIELGHREIWYIGDSHLPWYQQRYDGYVAAMRDAGLVSNALVEGLSDDPFLNGLHAAETILQHDAHPTAIIASLDQVAYGIWEMLVRHGIRVPQDVSLIGYDQDNGTDKVHPLTTVKVDIEEQGRELAQLAIRKIAFRGTALSEVIVPTVLVKNGSCRALRLASAGLAPEETAADPA